jgi:hypothetical protein
MECDKFRGDLIELARGQREDNALRAHLSSCMACKREFEAQVRLSRMGSALSAQAAEAMPSLEPGAMLLAEFDAAARPKSRPWWAAGAAIAAGILLTWGVWNSVGKKLEAPHTPAPIARVQPPPPEALAPSQGRAVAQVATAAVRHRRNKPSKPADAEPEQPFVAIPYTAPLGPYERAEIVRMDVPVSALIAAGFPMMSDPAASARADLVVGQDGRARAVRLISISDSTSIRSFQ